MMGPTLRIKNCKEEMGSTCRGAEAHRLTGIASTLRKVILTLYSALVRYIWVPQYKGKMDIRRQSSKRPQKLLRDWSIWYMRND